ncbi:putative meiotic recombination protein spo11 [Trypanosoma grayi]|uniref:putative meiotic recombination protein spo11 n=1 Tax=Trypanosoma grayi TaxID=71804 RepID=UPI0004F4B4D5|nr:putative meiotic recombination protein spo11 [Trypanosoma grayi]KEG11133.1 putative meiotic recombination protein spo11 [Trypanosoma grayi]
MTAPLPLSPPSAAAAAATEIAAVVDAAVRPAARHKVRPLATPPDADFMSPSVVSAHTPVVLTAEAVRRVEAFVLNTIHEIVNTQPPLPSAGRAAKRGRTGGGVADPSKDAVCETPRTSPPLLLRLQESRLQVIRLQLLVLRVLYDNLHLGVISTQRDIYYHLSRLVPDQGCVNRTIQQLVQVLGVPRQWLGVVPGTRGCVGGALYFHGVDLRRHGSEGMPLPTRQEELCVEWRSVDGAAAAAAAEDGRTMGGFLLCECTRYILVVEKHAVFFRLMEERIFERVPCVLLTSHGFPTVAARTLLANMHRAVPHLPVVALVDYNPSGLAILQQYKLGAGAMQENRYAAVHALHWLGLRSCHITQPCATDDAAAAVSSTVDTSSPAAGIRPRLPFQPFSHRDKVLLVNILARWHNVWEGCDTTFGEEACKVWHTEALEMQRLQVKVELETLYASATDGAAHDAIPSQLPDGRGFSSWVCRALLRHDYI